jgi:hypothetical protein
MYLKSKDNNNESFASLNEKMDLAKNTLDNICKLNSKFTNLKAEDVKAMRQFISKEFPKAIHEFPILFDITLLELGLTGVNNDIRINNEVLCPTLPSLELTKLTKKRTRDDAFENPQEGKGQNVEKVKVLDLSTKEANVTKNPAVLNVVHKKTATAKSIHYSDQNENVNLFLTQPPQTQPKQTPYYNKTNKDPLVYTDEPKTISSNYWGNMLSVNNDDDEINSLYNQ